MGSIESRIKTTLKDIKNDDQYVRFEALGQIYQLKQDDSLEIEIATLEEMIKTAAETFPNSVAEWDEPSFYLIDFVYDYKIPSLIDAISAHYDGFSPFAKERAIEFLCEFGEEDKALACLLDILENELEDGDQIIPLNSIFQHPLWVRRIVEKFYKKLENNRAKPYLYRMLSFALSNELLFDYEKNFIIPLLSHDYQETKKQYLEYDKDYNSKYVYQNWKENYLKIRGNLEIYYSLMDFYYTDETEVFLKEGFLFNDPVIKTRAVITALGKNVNVSEDILKECATNIECSEMMYWELLRIRKEHLFPMKENKQKLFVKSHLFDHLLADEEFDDFPEEINVLKSFELENYYEQKIRYYLVSFTTTLGINYAAFVGAYDIEKDDDGIYMWDGTTTSFVEFDKYSIDEHIENFLNERQKREMEDEESTVALFKPGKSKYLPYVNLLSIIGWVLTFNGGGTSFAVVSGILTAYAVFRNIYEKKQRSNMIELKLRELIFHNKKEMKKIKLHHIKKVVIEKNDVVIYDEENVEKMRFPIDYVDYELFSGNIYALTAHLKEPPFIDNSNK